MNCCFHIRGLIAKRGETGSMGLMNQFLLAIYYYHAIFHFRLSFPVAFDC